MDFGDDGESSRRRKTSPPDRLRLRPGKLAPVRRVGIPVRTRIWLAANLLGLTLGAVALPASAHDCDESHPERRAFGTSLFERMDENGDGRIVAREARRASSRHFAYLDENADEVLVWQEVRRRSLAWKSVRFRERFEQLDRDSDDRVSPSELELPAHRFAALDRDGDGFLSRVELESRLLARPNSRAALARARARFRRADADGDGRVTRREALEEGLRRFRQRDLDGDGTVTRLEARRARRAARRRPR